MVNGIFILHVNFPKCVNIQRHLRMRIYSRKIRISFVCELFKIISPIKQKEGAILQ